MLYAYIYILLYFILGEGRQSVTELLKNRLDPDKPTTYISNTSTVNYESWNLIEFGDDIGNNETLERIAVESFSDNITYVHLPIGKWSMTIT